MKQTAVLVDKRVAGIIRWLERLKKSYSSGAMESALMDAECARADLENLRLDVWATLDPEAKTTKKIFSRVLNDARVMSLAALIVMLTVFPLSKEIQPPAIEHDKKTITLAEPIIVIREEKNEIKNDNNIINANAAAKSPKKTQRTAAAKKPQQTAPAKLHAEKIEKKEAEQKTVAYDKVFSLMQTGQRALKNNSTVIKN